MAYMNDDIRDDGLQIVTDNGNRLDICSAEPTTFAEATSTYTLGNKNGITIGNPQDRAPSGREVVMSAISDGTVTGTDTATHFAIVDTGNSRLLAVQALSASQAVTSGNTFTLTEVSIGIPDVA